MKGIAIPFSEDDGEGPSIPWRGLFWIGLTIGLAFAMRMVEWPAWNDPENRLGTEWLLATHDAYHWVAGAEGFSFAVGHPMSEMLRLMAKLVGLPPAAVAFWFPIILSSLVAGIAAAWVWTLGSIEAGVAVGLLTSLAPGFLARTLLGFYDTDLITLFFPLLMTLAPATWVSRYMFESTVLLRRLASLTRILPPVPAPRLGNPLRWQWVLFLGLSGVISWWTQEWHSVFPYLIRYNVILLFAMSFCLAPTGRRKLLLLGSLAYALPALCGPWGFGLSVLLILVIGRFSVGQRFFTDWRILSLLWGIVFFFIVSGGIFDILVQHIAAYLKHSGDAKGAGLAPLIFPSVAQSIIEVQDLSFKAVLAYFHPWSGVAALGLLGFVLILFRRSGAFFLLPLAALGLLSTKLGGRMVMFGAPVVAIGLVLPLFWLFHLLCKRWLRESLCGCLTSLFVVSVFVSPVLSLIPEMSQGPMINRRSAEALSRIRTMTPKDAMVWIWWDWGYAAHHFAARETIADGARHGGPSLYLPAAVFATDNARFARQLIRYTSEKGGEPGKVFENLTPARAEALMDILRSPETPLIKGKGRQFLVVSYEMLRLGFWISNFGGWNFATARGGGGALSILPQGLAYQLDTGLVQIEDTTRETIAPASISVFEETGVTCRNYIEEWFSAHPKATLQEQQEFLSKRRNVHFFFNRVTGEKLAMDSRIYQSLMAQLLLSSPQDPRFAPYFKLLYDNVFARVYEVL